MRLQMGTNQKDTHNGPPVTCLYPKTSGIVNGVVVVDTGERVETMPAEGE